MRTLKKQLLRINIATTGAAILASLVLLFVAEMRTGKETLVQDMIITSDVIGNQCTAALAFSEPKEATEILDALRADAQIEYAAVYARDGGIFAFYLRQGADAPVPGRAPVNGHVFDSDHLVLTRPIILDEEQVGSISIRVGLERFREILFRYVMISVAALILALLASGVLLSRFQRSVTDPVTSLVRLMEGVSRDKDYGRRAEQSGPEELASLSASFNEMLAAIQSRDLELGRSLTDLQSAYRKLRELDRLKSEFITTVSHELRTPITSIKAFVEILLMKRNLTEDRSRRMLDTICRESGRLSRLINDLLDLSSMESGGVHWRDQDTDINEIVRTVIAGVLPLAQNKGVVIEHRPGVELPMVSIDRDRFLQVVMNLLSNAIKFTPEGGTIIVETTRAADPEGISLSVSDTGSGISPDELDNIFEKFHRAENAQSNAVEGTGLGLTICRSIVEHYGGRIWAMSEFGKGSVFTFTLPHRRTSSPEA